MIDKLKPYAKTLIGGLGLIATLLLAWFGSDSTVGRIVTVAVALASMFGIYQVPNVPEQLPAAVAALKAAQAKRQQKPPVTP